MIEDKRTEQIIGAAMAVHRELGSGFLESVYRNSLMVELKERGISAEAEKSIPVFYKGILVGDFIADVVVDGDLILELKATKDPHEAHELQLVNYLKATNTPVGLLFNFGQQRLLVKRKYQHYSASNPEHPENPERPVKKTGFTLLELMVAMAVLSILVVMMMGLVDSAAKLWRENENRVDAYREARAAMGIMARDLRNMVASTDTNLFLINTNGAFDRVPLAGETNINRAGAVFFLASLPTGAQELDSRSDVCEVGYFVGFERLSGATNQTMNLYRFFMSSDDTFKRLTNSSSFSGVPLPGKSSELLARNIREFRITPLVITNNAFEVFSPSTNRALPDLLEIRVTAVNQEAARKFTGKAQWTGASPSAALTNAQQTFTTRIPVTQPPPQLTP